MLTLLYIFNNMPTILILCLIIDNVIKRNGNIFQIQPPNYRRDFIEKQYFVIPAPQHEFYFIGVWTICVNIAVTLFMNDRYLFPRVLQSTGR